MKSITFFSLTLSALLSSAPSFAQTEQLAKVEIKSNRQTLVLDPSNIDNIQIKADKVIYDAATSTFNLTGKTKITVNENRTHFTKLEDEKATVRASSHVELQLDTAGSFELGQDASIHALAAALNHQYPPMNYRVQWSFGQEQEFIDGTALYDQSKGTVSEYIREESNGRYYISQRFYRGVTDKILIQVAKDFTKAKFDNLGGTAPFDFRQLTKYGCTVVTIR